MVWFHLFDRLSEGVSKGEAQVCVDRVAGTDGTSFPNRVAGARQELRSDISQRKLAGPE